MTATWAILATGPSMSQAVADSVRGHFRVAAVSDAYRLAPWADLMASSDAKWWRAHPEALKFGGEKYTAAPYFQSIPGVSRVPDVPPNTNSGLLACRAAVLHGARRLLLLGFDMRGDHFFGRHAEPLTNSSDEHYATLARQFSAWRPAAVEIINCTPGSALTAYPFGNPEDFSCL